RPLGVLMSLAAPAAPHTATPTAHPSTSPITHASIPRPASSSAARTGRSLVTHVLPAPVASRVTTANTAAAAKAPRGLAANAYGVRSRSAPTGYARHVTNPTRTGASEAS